MNIVIAWAVLIAKTKKLIEWMKTYRSCLLQYVEVPRSRNEIFREQKIVRYNWHSTLINYLGTRKSITWNDERLHRLIISWFFTEDFWYSSIPVLTPLPPWGDGDVISEGGAIWNEGAAPNDSRLRYILWSHNLIDLLLENDTEQWLEIMATSGKKRKSVAFRKCHVCIFDHTLRFICRIHPINPIYFTV